MVVSDKSNGPAALRTTLSMQLCRSARDVNALASPAACVHGAHAISSLVAPDFRAADRAASIRAGLMEAGPIYRVLVSSTPVPVIPAPELAYMSKCFQIVALAVRTRTQRHEGSSLFLMEACR